MHEPCSCSLTAQLPKVLATWHEASRLVAPECLDAPYRPLQRAWSLGQWKRDQGEMEDKSWCWAATQAWICRRTGEKVLSSWGMFCSARVERLQRVRRERASKCPAQPLRMPYDPVHGAMDHHGPWQGAASGRHEDDVSTSEAHAQGLRLTMHGCGGAKPRPRPKRCVGIAGRAAAQGRRAMGGRSASMAKGTATARVGCRIAPPRRGQYRVRVDRLG